MEWQVIPDLPLQKIFEYLPKRDRLHAALSCRRWYAAFYDPLLWRTFVFTWHHYSADKHKRMYDLEMYRLYLEFISIGRFFRHIIVPPNSDFYALHGFFQQWRYCIENHDAMGLGLQLHSFHLTFASEVIGDQAFGTGGRLLDTLKDVLARMVGLRCLVLDDLLLDVTDALTVLDEVIFTSGLTIQRLSVASICKEAAGFYASAFFPNLQILRLSPNHLNAEVLEALARETQISRLILRQNKFTMWPRGIHQLQYRPPNDGVWKQIRKSLPWLRVRLEICGVDRGSDRSGNGLIMWPSRYAPVDQVFFNYSKTGSDGLTLGLEMVSILADYSDTLTDFGYTSIKDKTEVTDNEFNPSLDQGIYEDTFVWSEFVSVCRRIEVLYLPNRMPSWLLMMIAGSLQNLYKLHVRRDLIHSDEFSKETCKSTWKDVSEDVLDAALEASLSISKTEREVAYLLRQSNWALLSDDEFIRSNPIDEVEMIRG